MGGREEARVRVKGGVGVSAGKEDLKKMRKIMTGE